MSKDQWLLHSLSPFDFGQLEELRCHDISPVFQQILEHARFSLRRLTIGPASTMMRMRSSYRRMDVARLPALTHLTVRSSNNLDDAAALLASLPKHRLELLTFKIRHFFPENMDTLRSFAAACANVTSDIVVYVGASPKLTGEEAKNLVRPVFSQLDVAGKLRVLEI
ncbi:hypothetical protein K438DRAFT_1962641 [Mycena galopus ATCC 62051]|nr:hypothetical protein K438DRAFT_1962641 [Mycena galopus ATCC 62051]